MKQDLLKTLSAAFGPPGGEGAVVTALRRAIRPYVDDIWSDALGNLIARRGRRERTGLKIMVMVQLDEVGLIVTHVDRRGLISFSRLGDLTAACLPGSRVEFEGGILGIVTSSGEEDTSARLTMDKLLIDVGAHSLKDCPVKIGQMGVLEGAAVSVGDSLCGKAVATRAGAAVLAETLRLLGSTPHELHFAFVSQTCRGDRGASVAAYAVEPELGLAVCCVAANHHRKPGESRPTLGSGPVLLLQDAETVADATVVHALERSGKKAVIPLAPYIASQQTSHARAIQTARTGAAVGMLGIPSCNLYSASERVDSQDLLAAAKLLRTFLSGSLPRQ